jgi:hypothetical protein
MKPSLSATLACLSVLGLAACANEPMIGSPGPTAVAPPYQPGTGEEFNERDFAWSRAPGAGSIIGVVRLQSGQTRYSCRGRDVILTPDTPWVRRRMFILYGSTTEAAVPAEIVRARTPAATAGDYASYARKTTCDSANRFIFDNLPDGAWYVITLVKPDDGSEATIAIMRRVDTRGAPRSIVLD